MPDPNCKICGGTGMVCLDVPTSDPRFGKPYPCKCMEKEYLSRKSQKLRKLSGIKSASSLTFDSFHPERCRGNKRAMAALKIALERWSERPKGWIILEGPYGCGKTHLAYACANKMLDLKMGVHIASMPDLLKTLKDGIGDDKNDLSSRLDLMAQCSVLIIDDLGVEKATEWSRESIFLIFNTRYHNRLPMLITTNEPLDSPNSNIDPRIRSRLSEGANTKNSFCRYNKIECEDYRPFKEEE